jgi:hypothetical protein
MNEPTTRIDYDQIRERAHRLRREAIGALLHRVAVKLRTSMSAQAVPRKSTTSPRSCGASPTA